MSTETLHHEIPYKDENEPKKNDRWKISHSYHGFIFTINLYRDPVPVFAQYMLPAFLVFLVLNFTYYIDRDSPGDKLANLGVCLLAFVAIHSSMRSNLP